MVNRPSHVAFVTVALIRYPGAQLSALYGLADLFAVANSYLGGDGRPFATTIIDFSAGKDRETGIRFEAFVLPPNLAGARGGDHREIRDWIAEHHRAGSIACSVCAGAFWLGHAGLLDGRPVTTHWALEAEFRAAFPRARLVAEQLLVDDHDVVTAGGVMAWLDLGLHLVERWHGQAAVSQVARHLLIDPRGREQRNYRSFRPELAHGDQTVLALQRFMEGEPAADLSVEALAGRAGLTLRTFTRRFARATGLSPNRYVQHLRVEKARGMLERGGGSIGEIAWSVGYGDLSAFTKVFRAVTGLTPAAYRGRFSTCSVPGRLRDEEPD